ncbi:hypothetical protein [Mangrovibacterium lignilyticum]|uniref:hypothetical protein n=1 Tax=Mangrovibacterium lignilyticum TaxID=2668052 RepID=UPI0013D37A77|nr:hypothetical protein [Mangrovibacterium lignilyticum]
MTKDLNKQQVETLAFSTNEIRRNIQKLKTEENRLKEKSTLAETSFLELRKQMSWREMYLGGFLGGNRSLTKQALEQKRSIRETKIRLEEIKGQLKIEADQLNRTVTDYLSGNSHNYRKIQAEYQPLSELLAAAIRYEKIIKKAKQGIAEALAWTSWNSLIKHPDAKKELNKFKAETENFQQIINSYEVESEAEINNGILLCDFIRFATQTEAMANFGHLLKHTTDWKNYSLRMLEKTEQQISQLTQAVTEELEMVDQKETGADFSEREYGS